MEPELMVDRDWEQWVLVVDLLEEESRMMVVVVVAVAEVFYDSVWNFYWIFSLMLEDYLWEVLTNPLILIEVIVVINRDDVLQKMSMARVLIQSMMYWY
jgi:hypothetical protein